MTQHPAPVRTHGAGQDGEQRGLARAAAAHDRHHAARSLGKGKFMQPVVAAGIAEIQVLAAEGHAPLGFAVGEGRRDLSVIHGSAPAVADHGPVRQQMEPAPGRGLAVDGHHPGGGHQEQRARLGHAHQGPAGLEVGPVQRAAAELRTGVRHVGHQEAFVHGLVAGGVQRQDGQRAVVVEIDVQRPGDGAAGGARGPAGAAAGGQGEHVHQKHVLLGTRELAAQVVADAPGHLAPRVGIQVHGEVQELVVQAHVLLDVAPSWTWERR